MLYFETWDKEYEKTMGAENLDKPEDVKPTIKIAEGKRLHAYSNPFQYINDN